MIDTKETEEQRLEYGHCEECNKINTRYKWCRTCNAAHFRRDFDKWTSGNKEIDYFIQNTQIHAYGWNLVLEWYPWSIFSGIKEIRKGGCAVVFRAKTTIGRISHWDCQTKEWSRFQGGSHVASKTIGHCESLSNSFLNEVII